MHKDYFKQMTPSECRDRKNVGKDGFFNQRVKKPVEKDDNETTSEERLDAQGKRVRPIMD